MVGPAWVFTFHLLAESFLATESYYGTPCVACLPLADFCEIRSAIERKSFAKQTDNNHIINRYTNFQDQKLDGMNNNAYCEMDIENSRNLFGCERTVSTEAATEERKCSSHRSRRTFVADSSRWAGRSSRWAGSPKRVSAGVAPPIRRTGSEGRGRYPLSQQ
jgi:hypothetical protein